MLHATVLRSNRQSGEREEQRNRFPVSRVQSLAILQGLAIDLRQSVPQSALRAFERASEEMARKKARKRATGRTAWYTGVLVDVPNYGLCVRLDNCPSCGRMRILRPWELGYGAQADFVLFGGEAWEEEVSKPRDLVGGIPGEPVRVRREKRWGRFWYTDVELSPS